MVNTERLIELRYRVPLFLIFRERLFRRIFRHKKSVRVLDVGCGNHSVQRLKCWLPNIEYHGVDRALYNNTSDDVALMERFYKVDLDRQNLDAVPDKFFDLVIFSHCIEHLYHGPAVVEQLCRKLRTKGMIYIEYPSPRSLTFPHMRGTLNFCDDETHIRVYSMPDIANILLANGCTILKAGRARTMARILISPVLLLFGLFMGNPAGPFWEWLGFAEYVFAKKKPGLDDPSEPGHALEEGL